MVLAYVLLDVDPVYLQDLIKKLDNLDEIDKIDSVFGEFNMLIQTIHRRDINMYSLKYNIS